ncbi:MAG: hypothetical protein ACFFDH_00520 [Promethearchaeota archaeon]
MKFTKKVKIPEKVKIEDFKIQAYYSFCGDFCKQLKEYFNYSEKIIDNELLLEMDIPAMPKKIKHIKALKKINRILPVNNLEELNEND